MDRRKRWTEREKEHLRILFRQGKSDEEIAGIMGRSVIGMREKRRQLGLFRPDAVDIRKKKAHKWTKDELEFIENYWSQKSDKWMARKLGVTLSTYKHKRQKMTVMTMEGRRRLIKTWTRKKGKRTTWTYAQEEYLREHYPTHSAAEIGKHLGRRENAIQWKAKRMGIKKAYNPGARGYEPIDGYYKKGCAPGGER